MPGYLLHQGAGVACMHGGQALPTAPFPRVTVSQQPITTMAAPYSVAGCAFNVAAAPCPCVIAQWVTPATRVLAGGMPVLLSDAQAVCVPNGTGLLISSTQVRVKGI